MQPKYAKCAKCQTQILVFGDVQPEKCPKCGRALSYAEEESYCKSCKTKVDTGVVTCTSCLLTQSPTSDSITYIK